MVTCEDLTAYSCLKASDHRKGFWYACIFQTLYTAFEVRNLDTQQGCASSLLLMRFGTVSHNVPAHLVVLTAVTDAHTMVNVFIF
jgi:hypothetical protein